MTVILRTILLMLLALGGPATSATTVGAKNAAATDNKSPNLICARSFKRSLRDLYQISDFATEVAQPENDFEKLYAKAQGAQLELGSLCHKIARMTETEVCISGIKSKERALAKVNHGLAGDPQKITDLVRATLIANDVESLVNIYQEFEQQAEIVKVKNRFKNPRVSGYRDLNLSVMLPETGLITEVQIHLKAIADIKNGPEHEFYEKIQFIERRAAHENRLISKLEHKQIQQMRQQSKVMYQQAWQPYLTINLRAA